MNWNYQSNAGTNILNNFSDTSMSNFSSCTLILLYLYLLTCFCFFHLIIFLGTKFLTESIPLIKSTTVVCVSSYKHTTYIYIPTYPCFSMISINQSSPGIMTPKRLFDISIIFSCRTGPTSLSIQKWTSSSRISY